jgi:hypothetical protein
MALKTNQNTRNIAPPLTSTPHPISIFLAFFPVKIIIIFHSKKYKLLNYIKQYAIYGKLN